jgi:hypothetical protein
MEVSDDLRLPGRSNTAEKLLYPLHRNWVIPSVGLDAVEKIKTL